MKQYNALMRRLQDGERILIDGATGTEIDRRGVPMLENAWNGGGAMTHPDIVRQVHEDYIRQGAQIVISNTFSTSRHVLQDAGLEEHFEMLNRRGVELAREARTNIQTPNVLVAGGITHWSFSDNIPPHDQLQANIEEQAAIMAEAGADLIMLEMMVDVERMLVLLEAAKKSGLPVWVGFSCELDEQGVVRLLDGPTLAEGIQAIKHKDVAVVCIMHTEVENIDACLDVLQENWSGLIGVYAHSGEFVAPNWVFNDVISPEDYASAVKHWLQRGVQVIGGCCGIGVEHIALLKDIVEE
ncbi:MAG: homocysteine S-methyltransferase family protein [Chloroflexi bacterium]|nr:homocysteine S-methyltransferase family protein [Chloroflexota bacterium]